MAQYLKGRWEALPAGDNMACVHGPRVKFIWIWILPWPYFSRAQLAERSLAHHWDRLRAPWHPARRKFFQTAEWELRFSPSPLVVWAYSEAFIQFDAGRNATPSSWRPCVRISFPTWNFEVDKKVVFTAYELITHLKIKHPIFPRKVTLFFHQNLRACIKLLVSCGAL